MSLQVTIAAVSGKSRSSLFSPALEEYRNRITPFCAVELLHAPSEQDLLDSLLKQRSRTAPFLVLLDSRGKSLTSEAFAAWLGRERDSGRQSIVFAIGPASGWSGEARAKADLLLSLGAITLPHELARLVLVEQVYRAFTILAGHPYHTGH